jgi:1-deoxy-D-xylulose-5-phosphate synthase
MVDLARNIEESIKNLWSPGMLFEEFGFRYFGPIDGHDIDAMTKTFDLVKKLDGPRIVHVLTVKGKGFPFEEPDHERFHARNPYDPATGVVRPSKPGKTPSWTRVFGTALMDLGREYPQLAAITAAMPSGTGTNFFQRKYPERFFDVGIAEAHATTFAAGLATEGIRPVVAIYSSFLQRAYDCVFHDVALQNLPVIFCMDRAGMVGADGQTHMGLYDIAYMLTVPGMTVTQPKDGSELIGLMRCALEHDAGPFSIRYPRDNVPTVVPPASEVASVEYGTWEVLREGSDCAILAVGVMCQPALEAVELLKEDGLDPTVVNCRFIKPLDEVLLRRLTHSHRLFVTVEEGTDVNGFGSYVGTMVESMDPGVRVAVLGIPDKMYQHATRARQLEEVSLTAEGIASKVRACATEESLTTA